MGSEELGRIGIKDYGVAVEIDTKKPLSATCL